MNREMAKQIFLDADGSELEDKLIDVIFDELEKEFKFTSCDDCKNKIDETYQEICSNCKRFYGCYFEAKEV